MRTYRSTTGPFTEAVFYEEKDIESICGDALRECGLFPSKPEAVRIDRFLEKRFGICHEYEDLQDGVLGYTRFGAKGAEMVFISKALAEDGSVAAARRMNSTLAHEAGHILLHAHLFAFEDLKAKSIFDAYPDFSRTRILCRDGSPQRRPWWEIQANKCIPALLMPQSLVASAIDPYLSRKGSFGVVALPDENRDSAARDLASVFDVNPQAVGYRLDALYPRTTDQLTL